MTENIELNGAGNVPLKRGRKPGSPKPPGSGRRKGTPNRNTAQTRERIAAEADPLGFLIKVGRGLRIEAAEEPGDKTRTWCYPTVEQRIDAMTKLLRKVLPDMRAVELTGRDGQPIETKDASSANALETLMSRLNSMSERVSLDNKPPTETLAEMAAHGDTVADSEGPN